MGKKKTMLILVIIILIVLIASLALSGNLNLKKEITVGNSIFTIPNGYHEGSTNANGDVNLTNGTNSIFIKEYNESISECVNAYKNFKIKNNYSIKVKEFNIDNLTGYKSTISNETNIHYWFNYNNKTYCIYTWNDNAEMDYLVIELMKTIKSN